MYYGPVVGRVLDPPTFFSFNAIHHRATADNYQLPALIAEECTNR